MPELTPIKELHQRVENEVDAEVGPIIEDMQSSFSVFIKVNGEDYICIEFYSASISTFDVLIINVRGGTTLVLPDSVTMDKAVEIARGIFGAKEQFCEWREEPNHERYGRYIPTCAEYKHSSNTGSHCYYCGLTVKKFPFKENVE